MDKVLSLVRIALGGLFIYASWDKILHPELFADLIAGYRIVPSELVTLVALVLPWLELLCGVLLLLGLLSHSSAVWMTIMSAVFLLAKISAVMRGLDISCGCLTVDGSSTITWRDVPMNLGLLLLCLATAINGPGRWTLDERFHLEDESQRLS